MTEETQYTIDQAQTDIEAIADELARLKAFVERHEHKRNGDIVLRA